MDKTDLIREYSRKVRVASYEIGAQGQMKLSFLMRMCQETSEQHLDIVGLSYEKLYEDGMVFLLITNRMKIKRMPLRNEEVTIKTHPRGVCGAQFYRDFKIYSGDEQIIDVMQTSVTADPNSHKILRPKKFLDYGVFSGEKVAPEDRVPKAEIPEDLPFVGERPIRYSDLDYNCHLNNTVYGDIVTDFLPGGHDAFRYAEVQINYINESALGDVLKIYAARKDGFVMMKGGNARGCGFTATATLLPMDGKPV
ncbi:acyl-ACP thioesterase [Caproiciproducens galactitolivorans]|uniref:Acyl-ACP thioesterase n=1 Tax=Caproiciproducens galactitolivorans TaxID=642589 RepID=A0A4Z0Y1Z4_9FIRM|nr:acyl-ACP thioesterase domain-containing protein [Caproiciproducens galactitolivorans]QEY35186.1 acyl-ACP thioesterase [Caproiciproducens galactitolivorans]TGJ76877.1 acyl-ACP thioesterase [Caproiciproducens galactitolivorans]